MFRTHFSEECWIYFLVILLPILMFESAHIEKNSPVIRKHCLRLVWFGHHGGGVLQLKDFQSASAKKQHTVIAK